MKDGELIPSMECYCNLRNVQYLLSAKKTPYEMPFGESFKGSIIPFRCNGLILSDFCTSSQGSTNLARKFYFEYSLDVHCTRVGGIWKGDTGSFLISKRENPSTIQANIARSTTKLVAHISKVCSSVMYCMRRESGKEIFWSQTWRNWRTWTLQKSIFEESAQKKY